MMTQKQAWFITKLQKELGDINPNKYDVCWFISNLNYASNNYNTYATSKKEASEDIQTLLNEKALYE